VKFQGGGAYPSPPAEVSGHGKDVGGGGGPWLWGGSCAFLKIKWLFEGTSVHQAAPNLRKGQNLPCWKKKGKGDES